MKPSRLPLPSRMPNEELNRKNGAPLVVQEIGTVLSSGSSIQSFSTAGLFVLAILYSLISPLISFCR